MALPTPSTRIRVFVPRTRTSPVPRRWVAFVQPCNCPLYPPKHQLPRFPAVARTLLLTTSHKLQINSRPQPTEYSSTERPSMPAEEQKSHIATVAPLQSAALTPQMAKFPVICAMG